MLLLINAGGDPVLQNKSGWTPLHIALELQSRPLVAALLPNGACFSDIGAVTLYREQAQWASCEPWYTHLTLKDYDYSAPSGRQIEDVPALTIVEVRKMIEKRFGFPSKVVDLILDMAEYWSHSFIVHDDQEIHNDGLFDEEYLRINVNTARLSFRGIKKVALTTKFGPVTG